jgi:hypothetical protein
VVGIGIKLNLNIGYESVIPWACGNKDDKSKNPSNQVALMLALIFLTASHFTNYSILNRMHSAHNDVIMPYRALSSLLFYAWKEPPEKSF